MSDAFSFLTLKSTMVDINLNSHTGISRLLAYIGLLSSLPSLSHGQKDVLATGDGSSNFCNYLEENGRTRPVRKKAEVGKIYRLIDNRCMDR